MITDGSCPTVGVFSSPRLARQMHLHVALLSGAPTITIDNDENENDAWNEYRHLFESNRSQMLNLSAADNYLLRHSSANTSLSDSASLEPLIDNHDDIFSMIEQAGITFGTFTTARSLSPQTKSSFQKRSLDRRQPTYSAAPVATTPTSPRRSITERNARPCSTPLPPSSTWKSSQRSPIRIRPPTARRSMPSKPAVDPREHRARCRRASPHHVSIFPPRSSARVSEGLFH